MLSSPTQRGVAHRLGKVTRRGRKLRRRTRSMCRWSGGHMGREATRRVRMYARG